MKGREAEVVEEVFAVFEVVQLRADAEETNHAGTVCNASRADQRGT